jgi:hypothetical protein
VTEYAIRHRRLELERSSKDDDAVQDTLIDAKEFLKGLDVAVVLVERVLEPELLAEVNGRPESPRVLRRLS